MFKCNPVAGAQFGHGGISTPLLHLQFFHCEESVRGHVNEIKVFETDLNTGLCMSYPTLDFVSKQTNKQKKNWPTGRLKEFNAAPAKARGLCLPLF